MHSTQYDNRAGTRIQVPEPSYQLLAFLLEHLLIFPLLYESLLYEMIFMTDGLKLVLQLNS